jgi:hypothetical protein
MKTLPFSMTRAQVAASTQPVSDDPAGAYSKDLNRMLSAAVVSRRFRNLLLSDPQTALHSGYQGESFQLSESERNAVLAIHAGDLRDFAAQLLNEVSDQEPYASEHFTPRRTRRNETASGVAQYA